MKTNIFLILFLGVSLCCYSQDAVDESILETEQAMKEAVTKYYYENFGVKDFFQKYPDYPRYVNTGDPAHGPNDYGDRVVEYILKHQELKKMVYDKFPEKKDAWEHLEYR